MDGKQLKASLESVATIASWVSYVFKKEHICTWFKSQNNDLDLVKKSLGHVRAPWTKKDAELLLKGYEEFKEDHKLRFPWGLERARQHQLISRLSEANFDVAMMENSAEHESLDRSRLLTRVAPPLDK